MVAAAVSKGTVLSLAEKLGGTTPSALRRSSIGTSATEDMSVCPSVVSNSASTVSSAGSRQASLSMIPTSELQKQKPKFGGTIKASNTELYSNSGLPLNLKVSEKLSKYASDNLHKSLAHLDFNNKPDDSTTRKRNSSIANMHRSQGAKLDYFMDQKDSRPPIVPNHHSFSTLNYDMSEDTSAHDDSTFHVDEQNSETWWDPNSPSKKGKKTFDKNESTNNGFQLVLEPERNYGENKDHVGHGSLHLDSLTRGITHDFNPFENSETSQQNQQFVTSQHFDKSHSSLGAKRSEGNENTPSKKEAKDSKTNGDKKNDKKNSKKTTTKRISVKVSGGDIDLSSFDEDPERAAKLKAAFLKWKEENEKAKQNENISGDDKTVGTTKTSSSNKSSSSSSSSSSKHRSRSRGPSSASRDEKSEHGSKSRSSSRKPTSDKTNEGKNDDERRRRSRSSTTRTNDDEDDRKSRHGRSTGKNHQEDDDDNTEQNEDRSNRRRSSSGADGLKKKGGCGEASSRRSEHRGRSIGRKGKDDSCSTKEENSENRRSKSLSNGLRKIAKESDESSGKAPTDSATVSSDHSKPTRSVGRTTPAIIRRRCQSLGRGVQRSQSLTSKDVAAVVRAQKEAAEEKSQASPEEARTRLTRGSEHKRSQSIGRSSRRLSNEDGEAIYSKSDDEHSDDGCDVKPHRSRSAARRREKDTSSCDEGSSPTCDRRSGRSHSVGRSKSVGRRRLTNGHPDEGRSKEVIKPIQLERSLHEAEKAN